MSVQANQTILTECSFAVTQDKLVQVITQVQPYEPHWENLPEIDLSARGIESVTRMKEFLPSLVRLDLSVLRSLSPLERLLTIAQT
jgi:protein NUD1